MDHLDDLWSEVSKDRDDVVFYAVNLPQRPLEEVHAAIEEHWKETGRRIIPVMQEGKRVSDAFGVSAYPTDVVIGPDGEVAFRGVGWDDFERANALEASIRSSIEGTKPTEGAGLSQPVMGASRWPVWRSRCFQHYLPEKGVQRCTACHGG